MKQAVTWDVAQNFCLEQGGVLAYYENEAEKAEYQTATDFPARRGRTWIGIEFAETIYIITLRRFSILD